MNRQEEALQWLFDHSFQYSPDPLFELASGVKSSYYIDCKMAFSYPQARVLFGELTFEKIKDTDADAIGGLIIGAYPLALAVSDMAYRLTGRELRVFVARKDAKPHGRKRIIEGRVHVGDRIIVVDDVVTSGESTIDAIKKSRDAGLEVVRAVALVDRQEQDGRKNIERMGVPFDSVFTISDFKRLIDSGRTPNPAGIGP